MTPEPITFFLSGPSFSWREKRKTHAGPCPKRGHCTVTKTSRHPETKGNREVIQKRGKRSSIAPSQRTQSGELALVHALRARAERPVAPWSGDVLLGVTFVFVPPGPSKTWPAWRRTAAIEGLIRPTGHNVGDRGQFLKMIEDGLEKAGFYEDDCRIADGPVRKAYGPVPGYQIHLEQLPPAPTNAVEAQGITQRGIF